MTSMKIALVAYLAPPAIGGVEMHVAEVARELASRGHTVTIHCSDFQFLNRPDRVAADQPIPKVTIIRHPGRRLIKSPFVQRIIFPTVETALVKDRPDIIHVHSAPSDHFERALRVGRAIGSPVLVTLHASPDDMDRLWHHPLLRFYWRGRFRQQLLAVNRIISIVEVERAWLQRHIGVSATQIVTIPNGVSWEELHSISSQKALAWWRQAGGGGPMILGVGRWTPVKGWDVLIDAAAPLLKADPKRRLLLIGTPEDTRYCAALHQQIRRLDLEHQIYLWERPRREVLCALRAATMVVLPTRGEVFGIVLAEGMALKKLVIASQTGGIPSLIRDRSTGLLVPPEDSVRLRAALTWGFHNPTLRMKIGQRAKKEIFKTYRWPVIVDQLEALYQGTAHDFTIF